MVVVMPGLYAAAAWLVTRFSYRPRLIAVWVATVLIAAVITYPFTPLP